MFDFRNSGSRSPLLSPASSIMLSEPSYNWVDITDEFFSAIKGKHCYR